MIPEWLRSRRSKNAEGRESALTLIERAEVLLEGFRPGVMERLGLAPETLLQRNPRLVYGRMTGWGQTGPLAAAGREIVEIAPCDETLADVVAELIRRDDPLTDPVETGHVGDGVGIAPDAESGEELGDGLAG